MPKMLERYGFQAALADEDLPADRANYRYLIERRDKAKDRITNGLTALNAASLLAVITAVGTDAIESGRFALTLSDLSFSGAMFILGLIAVVVSFAVDDSDAPMLAAKQMQRLYAQRHLHGLLHAEMTPEREDQLGTALEALAKSPAPDFEYSKASIFLTRFSAGLWIGGILLPFWRLLSSVHW